jgi:hypothetical protein
MRRLENETRLRGRSLLVLDTCRGGQAERLYTRTGWNRANRAGIVPRYAMWPDEQPCDTVIFWKRV